MKFFFAIEHEVAFFDKEGRFADFSRTQFEDFQQIIEQLPVFSADYPQLRVGDAGIKHKRWYVEGFERFSDEKEVIDCSPKGIEIRTTMHRDIRGAIEELVASFKLLTRIAGQFGYTPVFTSFNPYREAFEPDPPLSEYERIRGEDVSEKYAAYIPMVTYGPDLNISVEGASTEEMIDLAKKFVFYSPFMIPFSFSSPFYQGELWEGLSVRNFVRAGIRPAVMVFINKVESLVESTPLLTRMARTPSEVGRIEFKAFDTCYDFSIYAGLFALLKGLALDHSLNGRADIPDSELHRSAARDGFKNPFIWSIAQQIIGVMDEVLQNDPDVLKLKPLKKLLAKRISPAHQLIQKFRETNSMKAVLKL